MLKIKDNVDLKELEKFGFSKKYNVDTGEVDYYYKLYDRRKEVSGWYGAIKIKKRSISQVKNFKEKKLLFFNKKKTKKAIKTINSIEMENDYFFCEIESVEELLFDLIQAGLVEKVGGEDD